MKIEVTRAFSLGGIAQPVGSVLEVPNALAAELIALRKAVGVADDTPAATAKPAPKRTRKAEPVVEPVAAPETATATPAEGAQE